MMFVVAIILVTGALIAGIWLIRWGGMRIDAARANLDGTARPILDLLYGLGVAGSGFALCIAALGAIAS
jgi:hypothetical protein